MHLYIRLFCLVVVLAFSGGTLGFIGMSSLILLLSRKALGNKLKVQTSLENRKSLRSLPTLKMSVGQTYDLKPTTVFTVFDSVLQNTIMLLLI